MNSHTVEVNTHVVLIEKKIDLIDRKTAASHPSPAALQNDAVCRRSGAWAG